ncbi:MAG TPA: sulfite exporter TauE/SafE family protein [Candidatus Acidoferrum sp.]|nr:sulfite exporter TauE/SafE family protein [Candidatus Acidoferrum sp.]
MTTSLYFAAVLFVAYFVRGLAGFGSGLIAVPLLTLVAPLPLVVPLVVLLDYVGSASQGLRNAAHVAWREQLVLVPFMLVGVAVGLYLLTALPKQILARALGAFVILYAVYQLLPLPPLRGSRAFATVCGFFGGLVGTVFGAGGPFYVVYFGLRALDRTTFRATFAVNFLIDGGVRLIAYLVTGLLGWATLPLLAVGLPFAAAGLYVGGRIQTGFTQAAFVRVVGALLVVSGIVLLLKR